MIYNLYTIYDKVAEECGPVFQARNFFVAKRYVENLIKNDSIKLDEYTLKQVATFDSESSNVKVIPLEVISWDLDEICSPDLVEFAEEVKE